MLLEIWFPQIVIGLGGLGALFCFVMYFMSSDNKAGEPKQHEGDH